MNSATKIYFTRRNFLRAAAGATVTGALHANGVSFVRGDDEGPKPRRITRGAPQIFVDLASVAAKENVTQLFHQAEKCEGNPVLWPQQERWPWERAGGGPAASMIYDEDDKLFKCWYQGVIGDEERDPRGGFKGYGPHTLNYARSKDGIHWEKPDLGLHEVLGTKKNNVVIPPTYHDGKDHWESVRKDPLDTDPKRRYKGFGWSSLKGGLFTMWSPDGLNWTHSENIVVPGGDAQSMMIDTLKKRYVVFVRGGAPTGVHTSDDFVKWSERDNGAIKWTYPGSCYNMSGFVYGDSYLGWVTWFHSTKDDPTFPDLNLHLLKSGDGLHYDMVDASKAVVPCGNYGDWDRFMTMLTGAPPIPVGDKLYIYYRGFSRRHKPFGLPQYKDTIEAGALGMAMLRRDGFASLAAGFDGGTITTTPFEFETADGADEPVLKINGKANHHARIVAEVLGQDGKPIAGFTADECLPMTDDRVDHVVRWKGKTHLGELAERPIALRFQLVNARLYSYTIG